MPTRPKQHHPTGWKPYQDKERKAKLDRNRASRSARGYDWRWYKSIRPAAIRRAGFRCQMCSIPVVMSQKESTPTMPVAEVDHIDGNSFNNEPSNLRCLCKPCHSARTARDQGFAKT